MRDRRPGRLELCLPRVILESLWGGSPGRPFRALHKLSEADEGVGSGPGGRPISANVSVRISNGVRGARTFACHVGTPADAWWGTWSNAREILPAPAHSFCMGSHRRLPHIYPQDRWLFLTWHLYGSLPQAQYPPPHHLSAGRAFVWMDRYLDRAEWGPRFLQHESIATVVADSLWRGAELGHYQLGAFAV